jgi:hypothetical protein
VILGRRPQEEAAKGRRNFGALIRHKIIATLPRIAEGDFCCAGRSINWPQRSTAVNPSEINENQVAKAAWILDGEPDN